MDRITARKNRPERQGDPVDADELSRRLTAHLAEQNIKAYKRRNAKTTRSTSARDSGIHKKSDFTSTDAVSLLESASTLPTSNITNCVSSRATNRSPKPKFDYQQHDKKCNEPKTYVDHETNRGRHVTKSRIQSRKNQGNWEEHSSVELYEENLKGTLYQPLQRIFRFETVLRRKSGYVSTSEQMRTRSRETTSKCWDSNVAFNRSEKNNTLCMVKEQEARNIKDRLFHITRKKDSSVTSLRIRESRDTSSNETSPSITDISPSSHGSKQSFRDSVLSLFRRNINT